MDGQPKLVDGLPVVHFSIELGDRKVECFVSEDALRKHFGAADDRASAVKALFVNLPVVTPIAERLAQHSAVGDPIVICTEDVARFKSETRTPPAQHARLFVTPYGRVSMSLRHQLNAKSREMAKALGISHQVMTAIDCGEQALQHTHAEAVERFFRSKGASDQQIAHLRAAFQRTTGRAFLEGNSSYSEAESYLARTRDLVRDGHKPGDAAFDWVGSCSVGSNRHDT